MIFPFAVIVFLATFFAIPVWIKKARKYGFVERDVHKKSGTAVGLGGLIILFGFTIGLLAYVAYDVCNKRIISQYTVPEWTIFGGLMFPLIVFIVISAIAGFFKSINS